MPSDGFVLFSCSVLAATAVLGQTGCAYASAVTLKSGPGQPIERVCSDPGANAPITDARSYSLPDSSGTLWLVPCMRGAYQTAYNVVFEPDGNSQPRRLLFAQWRDGSWTGSADVFDPRFDTQSGVLTDQYKDRGAGDCGGARRWQWNGYDFRLLSYRARSECNGSTKPFPVIFEARP